MLPFWLVLGVLSTGFSFWMTCQHPKQMAVCNVRYKESYSMNGTSECDGIMGEV